MITNIMMGITNLKWLSFKDVIMYFSCLTAEADQRPDIVEVAGLIADIMMAIPKSQIAELLKFLSCILVV